MIRRRPRLPLLGYVIVWGLALAACGVQFREPPRSSELLQSLAPAPPDAAGDVRLALHYRQPYPVAIALTCTLSGQAGQPAPAPVHVTIPANDAPSPGRTPVAGVVDIVFPKVPPGTYTARCVTDKAGDALSTEVQVAATGSTGASAHPVDPARSVPAGRTLLQPEERPLSECGGGRQCLDHAPAAPGQSASAGGTRWDPPRRT